MCPSFSVVDARVSHNVVIWIGGNGNASVDVWFHPAFGDSISGFRHAFESGLAKRARLLGYDPPGHGASPRRIGGLRLRDCSLLWRDLIAHYSRRRQVVLVGHSMAGIIASDTAKALRRPPMLVIGVEANLTRDDAHFTGLAAQFDDPAEFHRSLLSRIRKRATRDESYRCFAANLARADPQTLWTLGRSVFARKNPGLAFRQLQCPKVYYWDGSRASKQTREYVARYGLQNRRLDRAGHWPMLTAPEEFYSAIEEDVFTLSTGSHGHWIQKCRRRNGTEIGDE